MKKACPKCGRIHDKGFICRPAEKTERRSAADKFRGRNSWKKKRRIILERDYSMCRICAAQGDYRSKAVSVHHITPLISDFSKRLDDDNLICLCDYHHELAEKGAISADLLRSLAAEQPFSEGYPPRLTEFPTETLSTKTEPLYAQKL